MLKAGREVIKYSRDNRNNFLHKENSQVLKETFVNKPGFDKRWLLALNPFSPMNWVNAVIFGLVYQLKLKQWLKPYVKDLPISSTMLAIVLLIAYQFMFYVLFCMIFGRIFIFSIFC